jgi:hypothetical protein
MSLGDLPNPRKRLPTPIGGENWPKRRHLGTDFFDNSVRDKETELPRVFGNPQQPAAKMIPDSRWDMSGTVELKIEAANWNFTYVGSHSALLSTYNSLAMMKTCLSSTNLEQPDLNSRYDNSC